MKPARVIALILGCILVLPAIATLTGGVGLALTYGLGRGDDGYLDVTIDRLGTSTVALTAEDLTFASEPGSPNWLVDMLDLDVRLEVTSTTADQDVFVGIAREADVDGYLAGVAHDEVTDLDGASPVYRTRSGTNTVAPPIDQNFWAVSSTGAGTQEIEWEATSGRWAAVVMNADGSPGLAVDVTAGAKSGAVMPIAFALIGLGVVLSIAAVSLIVFGAHRATRDKPPRAGESGGPLPPPVAAAPVESEAPAHPVMLRAALDPELSRWMWLVKWFLAIPHFFLLFFLWIGFFVATVIAGFSVLFTRRYPRGLFNFTVGVLRWSWRVSYYCSGGGLGTDRYPPFSLNHDDSFPATLDVAYPEQMSRGLVLVKWWLLVLPHYLILGVVLGRSAGWADDRGEFAGIGLLGLLVLIAGVALLFTGRYPRSLYDLIIGLNRWVYRVVVYAALMTDVYPPFRLDQGGDERHRPNDLPPPLGTPRAAPLA